jgi:hypothetical protein
MKPNQMAIKNLSKLHYSKLMRSQLFTTEKYSFVEKNVLELINSTQDIVNARSLGSPRAVGDAIQELLETKFPELLPADILKNYSSAFARRSMADFAFEDVDNFYYVVDNKTHNLGTDFNMPNLTSVERLSRFYEDDNNYFILLTVAYAIVDNSIEARNCHFVPIEHLDWSCLTLGALGWGQIQIANSNNIVINREQTRRTWMLKLCDKLADFYPKEIAKINKRITHFDKIREYWKNHSDF